jgi:hypothetical protein
MPFIPKFHMDACIMSLKKSVLHHDLLAIYSYKLLPSSKRSLRQDNALLAQNSPLSEDIQYQAEYQTSP